MTDVGQRGFSASTAFMNDAARRFVRAGFLRGSKIPCDVKVGMTTCAGAAFHFFHIKVTVGGVREGGGGFCAELPLKNTGLFGFYVCNTQLEFPSTEPERVADPAAREESIQTNIKRK